MRNTNEQGVAALLTIFVLGLLALLMGVSLVKTGYASSIRGRAQAATLAATYIAESGVEEALMKVQKNGAGYPSEYSFTLVVGSGQVEVKINGTDENQRIIESVGIYKNHVRRLKVEVQNTSVMPGFINAIHAGNGGVELDGNTEVRGKDGVPGNVYSKSYIKGKSKENTATGCKNSASAIYGSAWAVGEIDSLSPGSGVCITEDASATQLNSCYVHGSQFSPNSPLSCGGGISSYVDSIPIKDLPDLGVDKLKDYLTSKGNVLTGNCRITGSGDAGDCLGGTASLGDIKIEGDLVIDPDPGVTVFLTGPLWVTGNLVINSNSRISPQSTYLSQLTVVDGKITSSSNVTYNKNVDAFLLFISTYLSGANSTDPAFCANPAVSLSSNNESVLFYATVGCVEVNTGTAVGGFKGALLGEAIRVKNNTVIEYDPDLQTTIFGLSSTGGWQTLSFEEY